MTTNLQGKEPVHLTARTTSISHNMHLKVPRQEINHCLLDAHMSLKRCMLHTHTHTYTHTYTHTQTHTHSQTHTHTLCPYSNSHLHVHAWTCIYALTHIHAYTQYVCTHTHTHTHTHTYTSARTCTHKHIHAQPHFQFAKKKQQTNPVIPFVSILIAELCVHTTRLNNAACDLHIAM